MGRLTAFLFLITLFIQPVQVATEVLNDLQNAIAGWRRVLDVLDQQPDVADPGAAGRDLPPGPIDVRFDHVHFAYPATVPGRGPAGTGGPAPSLGPEVLTDSVGGFVMGPEAPGRYTLRVRAMQHMLEERPLELRAGVVGTVRIAMRYFRCIGY